MAKLVLSTVIVLAAAIPLRAATPELPSQPVPGLVVPASQRAEAISLLADTQIVELEYAEARHLLGIDQNSILGVEGPAYLVRAVGPNSAGSCSASVRGTILFVFCGSLGEFRYELRPIIVFLRQKPSIINISAMTAK